MTTHTAETDISAKRFYFALKVAKKCPNCEGIMERDFNDNYLPEPEVNKTQQANLYCRSCDIEYLFDIVIKKIEVTLEVGEELTEF